MILAGACAAGKQRVNLCVAWPQTAKTITPSQLGKHLVVRVRRRGPSCILAAASGASPLPIQLPVSIQQAPVVMVFLPPDCIAVVPIAWPIVDVLGFLLEPGRLEQAV